MERISVYTYNELYRLIKMESEKNQNDSNNSNAKRRELQNSVIRTLNDPTSQNILMTYNNIKTNLFTTEETIQDDRTKYIYKSQINEK